MGMVEMKITFLGTGGGRFSTISQRRMTGGFRIDNLNGKNLHVDPGPGALVRTYQFGLDPRKLNGIFISHAHIDHYTDAEILIESMTKGMTRNKGSIIGCESVFNGFEQFGPCISDYHKSKSENVILKPNVEKKFNGVSIRGTETIHGDSTCVGFFMDAKNIKISYTSDTQYFEGLCEYHEGADILIGSVLRSGDKFIRGHMCSETFKQLLDEVRPKLAIMTHFGLEMINTNPLNEARRITKETGIKTLAAYDGMKLDVNFKAPEYSKINYFNRNYSKLYRQERENSYQSSLLHDELDELKINKKN